MSEWRLEVCAHRFFVLPSLLPRWDIFVKKASGAAAGLRVQGSKNRHVPQLGLRKIERARKH
jgi:hypothetical protein